jgi:DNA-binding beta-propeller fold protein YncE
VANGPVGGGGSVAEVDVATGRVRVLTGDGFSGPVAVASDGTRVWVADSGGNAVTELNAATGALVQVLTGSRYGFSDPVAVAADGTRVWVANGDSDSVTEFPASTH